MTTADDGHVSQGLAPGKMEQAQFPPSEFSWKTWEQLFENLWKEIPLAGLGKKIRIATFSKLMEFSFSHGLTPRHKHQGAQRKFQGKPPDSGSRSNRGVLRLATGKRV